MPGRLYDLWIKCGASGKASSSAPSPWPRLSPRELPVHMTSRSFAALALTSSSRLRAPKISRPLTTQSSAPSGKPQSATTTRRRRPSAAPLPAAHHTVDHGSASPPRQQSSAPPWPSSSRGKKRPLLQPYELSRRIIELCKRGDVDLAVTALQEAPQNAQNIKVWNTIIQQCMDAKKYKLAYTVFTDVRP